MERLTIPPRSDWQSRVEAAGMDYHTIDGELYWDESACYRFTAGEIDTLEEATAELHGMCLELVGHVIRHDLFATLGIPEAFVPLVTDSWEIGEPSLYGRFDFRYDGEGEPQLLEYNADTPTAVLEASVVQWFWLKDVFPAADQFNSIHENFIDFWRAWPYLRRGAIHFACAAGSQEDLGNLEYLRDVAMQGGMETVRLFVEEIGWVAEANKFVDLENRPIETMFKLYPWEWLVREEFGPHLQRTGLRMLEPAWKMILSNKGILPLLWRMFPGHPNLLEASFDAEGLGGDYVKKPLLSREGENVMIRRGGEYYGSLGSYGAEGYVFQRYSPLPEFAGNYPVIGSWVVGGKPAGIGIREDRSEITTNSSRFVPHFFEEG